MGGQPGCRPMRIRHYARMRDTGGKRMNVLKNVVIILWAVTGTTNLIRHNIDRWNYLKVWGSLMAVLLIWR